MRRAMSFLAGAAVGSLVGATLALLLAPYSGDDLRSQLQDRVERVRLNMENAAKSRRAELEAQLAALREPTQPTESI